MPNFADGLSEFLSILPESVRKILNDDPRSENLVEVVLDYGRPVEARFRESVERMSDIIVSSDDLDHVAKSLGAFGTDNRAGIERTLHRISAMRNRHGKIVGLTCRVGRALEGTIDIIDDIIRSGQSILLLGKPGIGKTTKLREMARVLADEVGKRVVIVDTSNEIAGDGDVPHPGIGFARRMQVSRAEEQYKTMIEAVENHMPEVIVIDEIGNEQEAHAARTIAERGVQLVATAHGQSLENLMLNPALSDLIGGIQVVTLSDAEAARRGTQKSVLERKAPPTFDVVIELIDYDRLAVHHNVQKTVDLILRGIQPRPEIRVRTGSGMEIVQEERNPEVADDPSFNQRFPSLSRQPALPTNPIGKPERKESIPSRVPAGNAPGVARGNRPPSDAVRIYPHGIARTRLERAIREKRLSAVVTSDLAEADAVMAIRSTFQAKPKKLRDLAGRPIPTVVVKSNSVTQISEALDQIVKGGAAAIEETEQAALDEVIQAIEVVLQSGKPFELKPQPPGIRKMQHQVTEARRMACESIGEDPHRRLRVLPIKLI